MGRRRPINLLSDNDAAFGRCLGKMPMGYLNADGSRVTGVWDTPTFVHKSGGWGDANDQYSNVCFSHVAIRQLYTLGNTTINVCQHHPLGAYWRQLFCEAVAILGL